LFDSADNNGQWHQMAFNYNVTTIPNPWRSNVDGILVNSQTATARAASGGAGVFFGQFYRGDLDEVAVYDKP